MTAPTDRQLLDRLKRLMESAAAKAARWEAQNPQATEGDAERYRNWCHRQVWGKFLEVSSRLTVTVDGYSTSEGTSCVAVTYEEEMHRLYDAYSAAWEERDTEYYWGNIDDGWLTNNIDGKEPFNE